MNKNAGFTLIELLVVVLIIGIFVSAALPQYTKAVEKARVSEAKILMSSIQKSVDLYLLSNGFPSDNILLGNHNGGNWVETDLDWSHLNCVNGWCWSKYFGYQVHCETSACYVAATRRSNADETEKYHLSVARGQEKWDIWRCFNWQHTDIGRVICRDINGY